MKPILYDIILFYKFYAGGILLTWASLIYFWCCENICFAPENKQPMNVVGEREVGEARDLYTAMTAGERQSFLLNYMSTHSKFDEQTNQWSFVFTIGTATICCEAWAAIYGLSASTVNRLKRKIKGI